MAVYEIRSVRGSWGAFSRRKDAEAAAKRQREADRQAGNKGGVRVAKVSNPARKLPTGWIPASAVKIVRKRGGAVEVRIKRR